MKLAHWEFYVAIALIVCGWSMMFGDPNRSKLRKWIYWCIAPLIAIVCSGLAFNSFVLGLGFALVIMVLFIAGYFRFWL
jgi:hypothetical protein